MRNVGVGEEESEKMQKPKELGNAEDRRGYLM
jgi:hypothetical protein